METAASAQSAHNVAGILAGKNPLAPAIIDPETSLNYRQLKQAIAGARTWLLEQGLTKSDRLALSLPNVWQMPVLYYAALSLGIIVVTLNPLLSAREVSYHLQDSGSRLLVGWPGSRLEKERQAVQAKTRIYFLRQTPWQQADPDWTAEPVTLDQPALLLYTSGTTGRPKGAVLTHRNLTSNASSCAQVFGFTSEDRIFGGLPFFHAFGQTVAMNAALAAGASVSLLARFTAQAASALCRASGVSVLAAVPSMYAAIAAYLDSNPEQDLGKAVRFGISGGAPLPASIHRDFDRLLGCPIYEGYGLSETSPVVSFNQEKFGLVIGSVGRAIPGVKVSIRNQQGQPLPAGQIGQLWVAGENVMAGYWNNPQASQDAFDGDWFATGDLARSDEHGNIYLVDRMKDVILRNGYSVYPREIEEVIDSHPQVAQVAVVGKPHPLVGEEIWAFILARTELTAAEEAELIDQLDQLCQTQLAAYKYPRSFSLVTRMPLGPTGKILKDQL